MKRRGLRVLALMGIAIGCAPAACLAACTASTSGLTFGTYDVFSALSLDITGSITIQCSSPTLYSISISPGSGSYAARTLRNGPYALAYNLYVDPARLSVWGDGSAGTTTVSGSDSATHTVYGRIPPGQNVHVGTYSDTLIVTITY